MRLVRRIADGGLLLFDCLAGARDVVTGKAGLGSRRVSTSALVKKTAMKKANKTTALGLRDGSRFNSLSIQEQGSQLWNPVDNAVSLQPN